MPIVRINAARVDADPTIPQRLENGIATELDNIYRETLQQVVDGQRQHPIDLRAWLPRAPALLAASRSANDRLFVATDGSEPDRVFLWCQREAGRGWYVLWLLGPSGRWDGLTRYIAQNLVDAGFGAINGHFSANVDMPVIARMATLLSPPRGDYRGGVWVPSANGGTFRIRLDLGLQRLIDAGAPVEA